MSAVSRALPSAAMPWPIVATVVGSGIIASFQVGKAAIAAPTLRTELGLDLTAVGWLTAVFAFLGAIGGIPAGAVTAAVGDRRILVVGLLAVSLGAAAGAEAGTYSVLLASRAVEDMGFLLITVAGPAILQRVLTGAQRDLAFGFWSCFMPAGMALALLVGPLFGGWRPLWWASAGAAMAAAAVTLLLTPGSAARVSFRWRDHAMGALSIVRLKGPILLAGCFALYSLMFFALFSFLPVLLMERMSITYGAAGLFSALATGINIIGNVGAGYLLARDARRSALLAGAYLIMGLAGIGIFLPVFSDTPTFLLCLLFSGVGGMIPATLISSAPILAPSAALTPVVIGLIMQGSNLGQVIGPVVVGSAIEPYGWTAAAAIVVISALIAAAMAVVNSFDDGPTH